MKKKSIVIVIILLVITCIASVFYLRSRNNAPTGNLAIINGVNENCFIPIYNSQIPFWCIIS